MKAPTLGKRDRQRLAERPGRCAGKIHYDSWAEAEAAAILLMEDLRDGKLPIVKPGVITAYLCDICGRWAIGHVRGPINGFTH